jgi:hypothetical protein
MTTFTRAEPMELNNRLGGDVPPPISAARPLEPIPKKVR